MKRVLFLLQASILVLGSNAVAIAAPPQSSSLDDIAFERIDSRSGLSHSTVTALLQDKRGFLWVGTIDGLNRYDGYEFVVYRNDPVDTTTLSGNNVTALYESSDGKLWVGTLSGLNLFDPTTETAIRYRERGATDSDLRVIGIDTAPDSSFWITTGRRLVRYYPETSRAITYASTSPAWVRETTALPSHPLPDSAFIIVVSGPDDEARILRFSHGDDAFVYESSTTRPGGLLRFKHRRGQVWFGGLKPARFDVRTGAYIEPAQWPEDLAANFAYTTRSGDAWLTTESGIFYFDTSSNTLRRQTIESGPTAGLSNTALAMLEDRSGILWVGTRSGLYKRDPAVKSFTHVGPGTGLPTSGGAATVMAVEEVEGDVWLGTVGAGVLRLPMASGASAERVPINSPTVWSLRRDGQGNVWAGTEAGLMLARRTTGSFVGIPLDKLPRESDEPTNKNPVIFGSNAGPDGSLWFAGHWDIYNVDSSGHVLHRVPVFNADLASNKDNFVTCQDVLVTRDGVVWIGTEGSGLVRYDPAAEETKYYDFDRPDGEGLTGSTVWTLAKGPDDTIWLGTDRGLELFDPATGTFDRIVEGDVVYSILGNEKNSSQDVDDGIANGTLWLGTGGGIVALDTESRQLRRFDETDGTGNREFNRRAALMRKSGEYVFGGLNGLTSFYPERMRNNANVPPVSIIRVQTSNRDTTVIRNAIGMTGLSLSYRDYLITFEFSALGFTGTEKNQYSYRLEGLDDRWSAPTTDRRVRYTNLRPGRYVFTVRGSNNDGLWNEVGASMPFVIRPLFYQTALFRILVALVIALVLFLVYRSRVGRLRDMERMRLRIASDLHDDIGSRLSGLALMSDLVSTGANLTADDRTQLSRISKGTRQMVDAMRDIVWFVHPDHESSEALVERMEQVASSLLADVAHEIRCTDRRLFDHVGIERRRHVFLIYREALTNIARHASASAVRIAITSKPAVALDIEDDGEGFDVDSVALGNGLQNMRRRAAQADASLNITTAPGRGTRLVVTLD